MSRPEQDIQRAVFAHIRERGVPGLLAWHTNNNIWAGGRRGIIQGARNKELGVLAGVSDVLAFHKGRFFALELKAPGGALTQKQWDFLDAVKANKGYAHYSDSDDRAIAMLETWGLLRGRSV